ncbi:hypothetical protein CcaverHIS002_0603180 [Cutaneotrichosporon cavernicola]|uniref:Ribosomal protein L22 n=1 Tax=Cutaneotrichosporon cavernicola TaxID=279322 RepID=A0AA48L8G5_9TREE|nr:uncharacterized protein CcaverHIS019_0602650 [Cutaneotrichosporon cavernicola]BEI86031.1 hypothetical protein CcaverHIS002_0603180 [Cutaneotrichosporon cavernicola]BEI93806.1 hypothetical protein CcaverHIS019_0602650 [Cutaneotrichosporon cavernicola]BEJ01583.1 hypothetical protein CcaverHIS631_0602650 [Cutaneotrichosporon cavernicola]BEJ09349.1 hypothetical protein CcaverHIS641_0602640 [Cutaneotrichosporon cavernicola]
MSRTLRALSLAHSLSGPSRPLARPLVIAPAPQVAFARNASWFKNIGFGLPESWRRNMKDKEETAPAEDTGNVFDTTVEQTEEVVQAKRRPPPKDTRFKSAARKMSHRKLNDIGRLVAGMPADEAVLQLQFSEKRAARTWVKSTLAFARDHAVARGLSRDRLVVQEAWVSKGKKEGRLDIKGRGRMGIKHHPRARIHFILTEGKTWEEKRAAKDAKVIRQVRGAGMVREDGKLRRKMTSDWAW